MNLSTKQMINGIPIVATTSMNSGFPSPVFQSTTSFSTAEHIVNASPNLYPNVIHPNTKMISPAWMCNTLSGGII